jgi:hypothetical protein
MAAYPKTSPACTAATVLFPDHLARSDDVDTGELGRLPGERLRGEQDARRDHRAQVIALAGDGVERGRRAEVEDDGWPTQTPKGGQGVGHPVRPDLTGLVGQDAHAGPNPWPDHERREPEVPPTRLDEGDGEPGDDRAEDRVVDSRALHASPVEEGAEEQTVLVARPLEVRRQPPRGVERFAVEEPDGGGRVGNVEGEEHRYPPRPAIEPSRFRGRRTLGPRSRPPSRSRGSERPCRRGDPMDSLGPELASTRGGTPRLLRYHPRSNTSTSGNSLVDVQRFCPC